MNIEKIRADALIFSTHKKTPMRAAIFNRCNLYPRRRFQLTSTLRDLDDEFADLSATIKKKLAKKGFNQTLGAEV